MTIFNKLLILFIIGITSYILYRLLQHRNQIITAKHISPVTKDLENFTEGYDNSTVITLKPTNNDSMPLREYFVKSSYNTGYTMERKMDLEMIRNVILRGCRYLDFEIYNIPDTKVAGNYLTVIAYSNQLSFASYESSGEAISIFDVMNTIAKNVFSCANGTDPVFINFRVKSSDSTGRAYHDIAKAIALSFPETSRLYKEKVTGDTLLSELKGKAIFVMDKTYSPDYKTIGACNIQDGEKEKCYDLSKYINIETSYDFFRVVSYRKIENIEMIYPPTILEDGLSTNKRPVIVLVPDIGVNMQDSNPALSDDTAASSPSLKTIVVDYGIQFLPNRFYMENDKGLSDYEKLFVENGDCAFITMASLLKKIQ